MQPKQILKHINSEFKNIDIEKRWDERNGTYRRKNKRTFKYGI